MTKYVVWHYVTGESKFGMSRAGWAQERVSANSPKEAKRKVIRGEQTADVYVYPESYERVFRS